MKAARPTKRGLTHLLYCTVGPAYSTGKQSRDAGGILGEFKLLALCLI